MLEFCPALSQVDITGSRVIANKPVVAIAADSCLDSGPGACDMAMTSLWPEYSSARRYNFPELEFGLKASASCSILSNNTYIYSKKNNTLTRHHLGENLFVKNASGIQLRASKKIKCQLTFLGSAAISLDPEFTNFPATKNATKHASFSVPEGLIKGFVLITHPTYSTHKFKINQYELNDSSKLSWRKFTNSPKWSYIIIPLLESGNYELSSSSKFTNIVILSNKNSSAYAFNPGFRL